MSKVARKRLNHRPHARWTFSDFNDDLKFESLTNDQQNDFLQAQLTRASRRMPRVAFQKFVRNIQRILKEEHVKSAWKGLYTPPVFSSTLTVGKTSAGAQKGREFEKCARETLFHALKETHDHKQDLRAQFSHAAYVRASHASLYRERLLDLIEGKEVSLQEDIQSPQLSQLLEDLGDIDVDSNRSSDVERCQSCVTGRVSDIVEELLCQSLSGCVTMVINEENIKIPNVTNRNLQYELLVDLMSSPHLNVLSPIAIDEYFVD